MIGTELFSLSPQELKMVAEAVQDETVVDVISFRYYMKDCTLPLDTLSLVTGKSIREMGQRFDAARPEIEAAVAAARARSAEEAQAAREAEAAAKVKRPRGRPRRIYCILDQVGLWEAKAAAGEGMSQKDFDALVENPIFAARLEKKCQKAFGDLKNPAPDRIQEGFRQLEEVESWETLRDFFLAKLRTMPRRDGRGRPHAPNYYLGKTFERTMADLARARDPGTLNPWVNWLHPRSRGPWPMVRRGRGIYPRFLFTMRNEGDPGEGKWPKR